MLAQYKRHGSPFGQAQGAAQGQGYVGLTTGVTLAFRGRQVVGVDMDASLRHSSGQAAGSVGLRGSDGVRGMIGRRSGGRWG